MANDQAVGIWAETANDRATIQDRATQKSGSCGVPFGEQMEDFVTDCPDAGLGTIIGDCVGQLFEADKFLFRARVNERTVSGRLAHYLQQRFPGYHVDPEYNRHGIRVKTAKLLAGTKNVVPDIVVHRRNVDDHNLLVIELKLIGRGDDEDRQHAHEKLQALVFGEYHYRLGLYLEFGAGQGSPFIAEYHWYVGI